MKKDVAEKWVKALRSGRYKQTRGMLKRGEGKDASYCCLGVLCRIAGRRFIKKPGANITCLGKEGILPKEVMKQTGIRTNTGDLSDAQCLTSLNDNGRNFKEIADIIEQNWKKL